MAAPEIPMLSLGTSDFAALREANQIYVDKTALVFELAQKRQKYFLARPRRFGKSLLISTFESLFKKGLQDFQGLKIENLWKEEKTYPVVRLDFSEIKPTLGFEVFIKDFEERLAGNFAPYGFNYAPGTSIFGQLSDWFKKLNPNSLVLLIDEFDAPLNECLDDDTLFNLVRSHLSKFYSVIKSNDAVLRFLFITGITKFNKTNIFAELNNLNDITFSPRFGALLGFTAEEIRRNFDYHLGEASGILGTEESDLLDDLEKNYDGYCFEESITKKVFSPWSVLKFLDDPERGFRNYWYENGGKPAVLLQYLRSHTLNNPQEYGRQKSVPLSELTDSSEAEILSDICLLTQAGYLTLKSIEGNTAFVGYPNLEVARSMAQLYSDKLLGGKTVEQVGALRIPEAFNSGSLDTVIKTLNTLFDSVDYRNYPVKDEAAARAFTQVFLSGAGLKTRIADHSSHGRGDLEVEAKDCLWIFEFIFCRAGSNPEITLLEGLRQMEKRELDPLYFDGPLHRVVLAFSQERRKFVRWVEVTTEKSRNLRTCDP